MRVNCNKEYLDISLLAHQIRKSWIEMFVIQQYNPTSSRIKIENTHWLYRASSLRKHAYSNILKILQPKTENFQIKTSDIFHISGQNIDCGY